MAFDNRYSTIVFWAKVSLPLLGLALLSTMFLFSQKPDPEAALPFADVDVEQLAREQRLSQPRFAGTLNDGREVTLVAESAAPEAADPNTIHLDVVEAQVALSEDNSLLLNARTGAIDLARQAADLGGDVTLVTTQGYRLESAAMTIDMQNMRIVSPEAVRAIGPGVTLEAGAMDLSGPEGEAILSFTGGVRLLYEAQEVEQ